MVMKRRRREVLLTVKAHLEIPSTKSKLFGSDYKAVRIRHTSITKLSNQMRFRFLMAPVDSAGWYIYLLFLRHR